MIRCKTWQLLYPNIRDFVCLFDLILNVRSTIFQLNRDGASWVEPVLSYDKCVLLKDHNAVTPVRLEPAVPRSRVKHSTTEPLRSQNIRDVKPLHTLCIPETPNWVLYRSGKTQMKCHPMCHFIRVCTVCYGKIHTQRKKIFQTNYNIHYQIKCNLTPI